MKYPGSQITARRVVFERFAGAEVSQQLMDFLEKEAL